MLEDLTEDDLIEYHKLSVTNYSAILKKDLLKSCLSSWHYYDTIEEQISSIVLSLLRNHCFIDGNKRVAAFTLLQLSNVFNLNIIDDNKLFDIILNSIENKTSVEEFSIKVFKGKK